MEKNRVMKEGFIMVVAELAMGGSVGLNLFNMLDPLYRSI